MKPVDPERLEALEEFALVDCIAQVRALFTYKGDNPGYYQRAKVACGTMQVFGKVRQSETAREAIEATRDKQGRLTRGGIKALSDRAS